MATCDLPASGVENPSAAALHQLKELLQGDPAFAQALRATESTEAAAGLAAEHGIAVTRGALASARHPGEWRPAHLAGLN